MAGVLNLEIAQGATFTREIFLTDGATPPVAINLGGYSARAMIKASAQDATAVAEFLCTFSVDRSDGKIVIILSADQTAAIPTTGGNYAKLTKYVWDMEIEDSLGVVTRILNGLVDVSPEVTK